MVTESFMNTLTAMCKMSSAFLHGKDDLLFSSKIQMFKVKYIFERMRREKLHYKNVKLLRKPDLNLCHLYLIQ